MQQQNNNNHSNPFYTSKAYADNYRQPEVSDQQVGAVLREAKNVRDDSLRLTREALQNLDTTEKAAGGTLTQLTNQSEMLYKSKRNLEVAKANERVASDQVSELKRLNKFFAFRNPFRRRGQEKKLAEAKMRAAHEQQLEVAMETKRGESASRGRLQQVQQVGARQPTRQPGQYHGGKVYSDLLDDEDRQKEVEIENNLDMIGDAAARLKAMAMGMRDEVDDQNKLIGKMDRKAGDMTVNLGVAASRVQRIG